MFTQNIFVCAHDSCYVQCMYEYSCMVVCVYFTSHSDIIVHKHTQNYKTIYILKICVCVCKKASIVITFYSALTIQTSALMNFGLRGTRLGLFLVLVNVSVLLLSIWFAIAKYRLSKVEKLKTEALVSFFFLRFFLNTLFEFNIVLFF
jgi:hypothetical protein